MLTVRVTLLAFSYTWFILYNSLIIIHTLKTERTALNFQVKVQHLPPQTKQIQAIHLTLEHSGELRTSSNTIEHLV